MTILSGMKQRMAYGVLFLLFALVACQKKSISFGGEFTESFTNIVQIDTLTAALSTFRLDTFATSGSGVAIVGRFSDPVFGTTVVSSYQQLRIPYTIPTISAQAIFDSLSLYLTPTKDYYGDTTLTQQINVHELTQTLAYRPQETLLYNNNTFSYDPTPLGTRSFTFSPSRTDSLLIRLSDTKGNELFTKLKEKSDDVTLQDYFLRYLKGLVLVPSVSSSEIINYKAADADFKMRLYYHELTASGISQRYIEFPFYNPGLQFNNIAINRTAAPLNSLPASGFPEVPSASLDHKAFMQYGAGLFAKVSFPSLQDLYNIDVSGKILKAELIIKPAPGTYDKTIYSLPEIISLRSIEKNNMFRTSGSTFLQGYLVYDDLFGDNTGYTVDITSFLQKQIQINEEIREGLIVYLPSMSSFDRMIIGDKTTGKYGIQLKVYYLVIR